MLTNPALLASLFLTSVSREPDVAATDDAPAHEGRVLVHLSDGSAHPFETFIETGASPDGAPTFRVGVTVPTSETESVLAEGPIVNEMHRGMFESVGVEFPDMSAPVPEPPAGPTEEAIAQHAPLQAAIDAAADLAAAALAPSHPGIAAAIEALEPIVDRIPTQQHVDRLHALFDVAARELPAAFSWVVKEMRVIHADLRSRITD